MEYTSKLISSNRILPIVYTKLLILKILLLFFAVNNRFINKICEKEMANMVSSEL
jgi:hypothetical protein